MPARPKPVNDRERSVGRTCEPAAGERKLHAVFRLSPLARFGRGAGGEGSWHLHNALVSVARVLGIALCLLSVCFGRPSAGAELSPVVPVDGASFAGRVTAIGADWQITFETESRPRKLSAASIVRWGRCAEFARGPVLVLSDGSVLAAELVAADRESLTADSRIFGAIKVPRNSLAGLIVQSMADHAQRDRFVDRILSTDRRSDHVVLLNGDELACTWQSASNAKLSLTTNVGPLQLETRRAAALLCKRQRAVPAAASKMAKPLGALAGFRDGSRLRATAMELHGDALQITLDCGLNCKAASSELVFLQPLGGQVVYLSDLQADGYRHVPYFTLSWPYRADRSVLGTMLRSNGRLYLKGLGMHSTSRLTYLLGQPYRRFCAEVAVDDETEGGGSVGFRVFVDGQLKYTSPIQRGGATIIPISIDVSGAKRLDLVVDFADRADELDHADWLDARLVR